MKILFADKFPDQYYGQLKSLGHECEYQPDLTAENLAQTIADFEILVVRSTRVDGTAINAGDRLKLVVRAGAGTNTIDKDAATEKEVCVCNVPGKNALAVAELAMGLILAIDRNIPDNVVDLRAGKWNKKRYSTARGVYGRSIGVVGLGAIGLALAERAAAFGMRVHVIHKPQRTDEVRERLNRLEPVEVASLDELADHCDVLSFHVPASTETRQMVNEALLSRLAAGSIIINTSRGDIVDESALIEAMNTRDIRAGLDVYQDEPGSGEGGFESALGGHPNVYGTHHIGASTTQAQNAVAEGVVEIIEAFEQGQLLHCVNLPN